MAIVMIVWFGRIWCCTVAVGCALGHLLLGSRTLVAIGFGVDSDDENAEAQYDNDVYYDWQDTL